MANINGWRHGVIRKRRKSIIWLAAMKWQKANVAKYISISVMAGGVSAIGVETAAALMHGGWRV